MHWIHRKDQTAYEGLMKSRGHHPEIMEQNDKEIYVMMPESVVHTWAAAGYWFR